MKIDQQRLNYVQEIWNQISEDLDYWKQQDPINNDYTIDDVEKYTKRMLNMSLSMSPSTVKKYVQFLKEQILNN